MATIEVDRITKKFGAMKAVDEATFSVQPGEIFGLLGPNGAGKTTIIRIILDLFKPDSGTVSILNGPMTEAKKDRIGYLPEERGLYQEVSLERGLVYLATLKGLSHSDAKSRIDRMLERFDLGEHRHKKIKELSKGMQQKAQLIVTLVHEPELVIIDEPFSALDPVNTQMVKDLLREERDAGKTIVMCTHQMHQAEELSDRLVVIHRGHVVLDGRLADIQRSYAGQEVIVRALAPLPATIPGVEHMLPQNGSTRLQLTPDSTPQELLRALVDRGVPIEQFEIAIPTLDEIFIRVVTQEGAPA